ncbi:MAG TPA: AraC family transcriptional regulator [Bacilli bacterium]
MQLNFEGVEIDLLGGGRISPNPDWTIHAHAHDTYEIHFITGGIGHNQLENGELDFYPNIVYLAPPHEVHSQSSDKNSPLELYFSLFRLTLPDHQEPLSRIYAPFSFVKRDLETIFRKKSVKSSGDRFLENLRLIELIWKVLQYRVPMADSKNTLSVGNENLVHARILEQAVLYIQTHFYRNPSVAEIAEASRVSERHLSRVFLNQMRMTVHQFVQNERLLWAVAELKHSSSSIREICDKLQFSSTQYFSQWFKQMSSLTPDEFCKNHARK